MRRLIVVHVLCAVCMTASFAASARASGETNDGDVGLTPLKAPDAPPIPGEWTPVFEDNFDGPILDSNLWKVAQHWNAINGGAQPHQDNMAVEDGCLVLTWDKKDTPFTFGTKKNRVYGTGEVTTYKRWHHKYGYWECRWRYDVLRTCFPAVWTMPACRPTDNVNNIKWGFIKFDLRRARRAVTKAVLRLKVKHAPAGYWFDVYRCLDDSWSEDEITWQNQPNFDAIFLDHVNPAPPAGSWVEVDVTEFVRDERAGDRTATFVIAEVLQQKFEVSFHSSEAAEADRPHLLVDGVAVPATEDSYVFGNEPTANFGDRDEIAVTDMYGYMVYTGGPGMEIDIMETLGVWGPGKLSHAVHWDGYGKNHKHAGHWLKHLDGLDLSKFTTVGMYWTEGRIEFYVNGKNTWTHRSPRVCSAPSWWILSAQTGGWHGNARKRDTVFEPNLPNHMYVDWVKVWAGTKGEPAPTAPAE